MKSTLKLLALSAIAATALGSCSADEDIFDVKGEGTIFLSATLNSDVKARSSATDDELRESCIVWISNSKGVVRRYDKAADIPSEGIKLVADNYVAEAWAGDSVPASFEDRYFKGSEAFTVSKGSTTVVNLVCHIANTLVDVKYGEGVAEALSDYTMTVGHAQGSLTFEGDDTRTGYFMMNSRSKNLDWTLRGKLADGSEFVKEGTIENCKPTTKYTLNVKWEGKDYEIGGAYLTIEVDETEVLVEDEISILAAPKVEGYNFDLATAVRGKKGEIGRRSLWITSADQLAGIVLTCDYFNTLFGFEAGGNDFDFLNWTDATLESRVNAAGIVLVKQQASQEGMDTYKLIFEEEFTNALPDGEYSIRVDVTDKGGKRATGTLNIIVSDDPVSTAAISPADAWATRATIAGTVNKPDAASPVLCYRKRGTAAWTKAETTVSGGNLSATVTGLEPATTYEYAACADGFEGKVMTFTTEGTGVIPEAGFENWYTYASNKLWAIGTEGASKYWDCGNTALESYTLFVNLDKNPTSKSETYKHSGNSSVRLKSVSIVGVFAAGNMFIGEFLGVEDGTNGILGWGRPWDNRPSKLKGWVRYEPQAVTHEKNDYAALKKGDMDKGIIYIALLDNSISKQSNGKTYPVVVRTSAKNRDLFSKDDSNVIGYGELVLDQATAGDGMVEFEIPITYKRTDVKASYIMCTASASIGGDYFVGGENSSMWLDDLELVYE